MTTAMPLRLRAALRLPVSKARASRNALPAPIPRARIHGTGRDAVRHAPRASAHAGPATDDVALIIGKVLRRRVRHRLLAD